MLSAKGEDVEHSESFRAMNTTVDLLVVAPERPALPFLETRLLFEQQEARFSRFRPGSLVSRLNRGDIVADPWLDAILPLALAAFEATGGLFNPLILPALAAAGYDRSFEHVAGGEPRPLPPPDPRAALERLPAGWRLREGQLDLGGIVKGWTADLAAEHLAAAAGAPAMVNAGGDIRCVGEEAPGLGGWQLAIDGPGGEPAWSGVVAGALATSTTRKRRWRTAAGGEAHHLIDPRTGLPARSPFVQVSVLAAACREAETWAKAILIAGPAGLELAAARGLAALAFDDAGRPAASPAWPW
ncbi:FAD:protein FMN transferase [Tepidiforma flava]|uniref:FAD:protein FMN transferase n=1 Tax=Tepidiforma flava TaxID=3004094 RepID=A0ABY7M3Z7_9CHLR|nr:FAD:protein FMN transferase [Tepidiforma flava]WBL35057.1 FAD:protein FMN transferase [Tepidiforma flava]